MEIKWNKEQEKQNFRKKVFSGVVVTVEKEGDGGTTKKWESCSDPVCEEWNRYISIGSKYRKET
jgi:hypothetical protein